jgi:hypothetical protein
LEGKAISVLGDGFVVASPNNPGAVAVIVANGTAVLDKPYAVIHAGLPYLSDLETLDVDTAQGETLADKKKNIGKLVVFVESSRGIFAGPNSNSLVELKTRFEETMEQPVELSTGTEEILIQSEWNSNGRIFVRQFDPLPLSVLAVAPVGYFPVRG